MATCTLPLVIDLLVQKFQGLALVIDGQPVKVYDGPEGPDEEDNFVLVMGWPGADAPCKHTWAYIGGQSRYEAGTLAVVAFSYVGGDDSTATFDASDAQATARANVAIMQSAIEQSVVDDPNLSVQNDGVAPVIWILNTDITFDQTPPDEEGEMGRYSQCAIKLETYNVLGSG